MDMAMSPYALSTKEITLQFGITASTVYTQIVYWHRPSVNGASKLRVFKEEYMWLAKSCMQLAHETGLPAMSVRRAIAKLREAGLIFVKKFAFRRSPTNHIRLNLDAMPHSLADLVQPISKAVEKITVTLKKRNENKDPDLTHRQMDAIKSTNDICSNRPMTFNTLITSLTDTVAETPSSEIKNKELLVTVADNSIQGEKNGVSHLKDEDKDEDWENGLKREEGTWEPEPLPTPPVPQAIAVCPVLPTLVAPPLRPRVRPSLHPHEAPVYNYADTVPFGQSKNPASKLWCPPWDKPDYTPARYSPQALSVGVKYKLTHKEATQTEVNAAMLAFDHARTIDIPRASSGYTQIPDR